jgi:hypothetical protein
MRQGRPVGPVALLQSSTKGSTTTLLDLTKRTAHSSGAAASSEIYGFWREFENIGREKKNLVLWTRKKTAGTESRLAFRSSRVFSTVLQGFDDVISYWLARKSLLSDGLDVFSYMHASMQLVGLGILARKHTRTHACMDARMMRDGGKKKRKGASKKT